MNTNDLAGDIGDRSGHCWKWGAGTGPMPIHRQDAQYGRRDRDRPRAQICSYERALDRGLIQPASGADLPFDLARVVDNGDSGDTARRFEIVVVEKTIFDERRLDLVVLTPAKAVGEEAAVVPLCQRQRIAAFERAGAAPIGTTPVSAQITGDRRHTGHGRPPSEIERNFVVEEVVEIATLLRLRLVLLRGFQK